MEEKLRLLEKENARLSTGGAAGTITQAAAAPVVAAAATAAAITPEDKAKAENLERIVNELKIENRDMKQRLALAETAEKMPAVPPPAVVNMSAEPPESEKVQALQNNLNTVQAEKGKLQAELETMRRKVEDKQVASAGGDPELEKAVRRYNEAEREIQRLGSILEKERATTQPGDTDGSVQAKRVALLEKEVAKVKGEQNAIADEQKAKVAQAEQEVAKTKTEILGLQKANANLKTELDQVKTALASTKQAQAQVEDQDLAKLEGRIAESEKAREELREQNLMFKAELEKAKNANTQAAALDDVQAQLKAAQEEKRQAQQKLVSLEEELRKMRATVALNSYRPETKPVDTAMNEAAPAAGFEPPPLQPVAAAVPVSVPAKPSAPSFSEKDVKSLLSRANIPLKGGVRKAGKDAYTWTSDSLKGRTEVSSSEAGFAQLVDQHINKAKSQCKGDFAAIPSAQGSNNANFEVACVNASGGGTSSSFAFFEEKGSFVAVSVETGAENMDVAMDTRDKIASVK
jgi:chromosome segregation ATPase